MIKSNFVFNPDIFERGTPYVEVVQFSRTDFTFSKVTGFFLNQEAFYLRVNKLSGSRLC